MKYTLFTLVFAAALVACSDKAPDANTAPGSAASARLPMVSTAPLSLPSVARPASLPLDLSSTDQCFVDRINDAAAKVSTTVTDKSILSLHGWAADVAAGTTAKEVYLELDGPNKQYVKALVGVSRPDVAEHFKKPSLGSAGWDVSTTLTGLPNGSYVLRVIQLHVGNIASVCETSRVIVVG